MATGFSMPGAGSGGATLKGKINQLEETIRKVSEEINHYKKEMATLQTEKEHLEKVLEEKSKNVRDTIIKEISKTEGDMKQSYSY